MQDKISLASKDGIFLRYKQDLKVAPERFFIEYKDAFGLGTDDEIVLYRTKTDKLGFTHYRFQQKYKGLVVEGAEYILHYKNGNLRKSNGMIIRDLDLGHL